MTNDDTNVNNLFLFRKVLFKKWDAFNFASAEYLYKFME